MGTTRTFELAALYDMNEGVWTGLTMGDDGLVTEAPTMDELAHQTFDAALQLAELESGQKTDVSVTIHFPVRTIGLH